MNKTKLQIKSIFGKVLFEHKRENNTIKLTLEEAVKQTADLSGADLSGADLSGANLSGADLSGADLSGVNLWRADLSGAIIKDFLVVGNIGSRADYTMIFDTDKGIMIKCGCFFGNIEEFIAKVSKTHGDNEHARNYLAMLDFAKVRFGMKYKKNSSAFFERLKSWKK